ncbi:MAG: hypothetical protein ACTSX8_07980 [Alphaproteobacteria bacterium]
MAKRKKKATKKWDWDYRPTPPEALLPLFEQSPPPAGARIWEPSAGTGHIVRMLVERGHPVTAVEIQSQFEPALIEAGADRVIIGDWFDVAQMLYGDDICVVGNPPYTLWYPSMVPALAFAESIVAVARARYCALLLPLDFAASVERFGFHVAHPVKALHPLAVRPSFTGNGKTNDRNVAWFVWHRLRRRRIYAMRPVLPPPEYRDRGRLRA